MHDNQLEDHSEEVFLWEAKCGVCYAWFDHPVPSEDNPYPHGAFCPVCRNNGLMAPGVLHFKPKLERQL